MMMVIVQCRIWEEVKDEFPRELVIGCSVSVTKERLELLMGAGGRKRRALILFHPAWYYWRVSSFLLDKPSVSLGLLCVGWISSRLIFSYSQLQLSPPSLLLSPQSSSLLFYFRAGAWCSGWTRTSFYLMLSFFTQCFIKSWKCGAE